MALTRPKIWDIDTNVEWFVDPITVLHQASTLANVDVGFLFNRANGLVSNVALYWNESSQSFVTAYTSSDGTTNTNIAVTSYANITTGNIVASAISVSGVDFTTNVVSLQSQIAGANAAIVTANTAMKAYVDAANTIQSSQIATLQGQVYTNANVAAYLPSYGGNLTVGNLAVTGNITTINYETVLYTETANVLTANVLTVSGNTTSGNVLATGFFYANGAPFVSSNFNPASPGTIGGTTPGAATFSSLKTTQTTVTLGASAGAISQGTYAIGIGTYAGYNTQGAYSVVIGGQAGQNTAGAQSVLIGYNAGFNSSNGNVVAIGSYAGTQYQGQGAVAVGPNAGSNNQASNAIAIGNSAGVVQSAPSIILNSSGNPLNDGGRAGFIVSAVRNDTSNVGNIVTYNTTTNEFTYSNTISIVGTATVGNVITTNGVFWSNGSPYSSGGSGTGITYTASNTVPASAHVGDQWYYQAADTLYEYINDGTQLVWVDVQSSPTSAGVGSAVTGNLTVNGNLIVTANTYLANNFVTGTQTVTTLITTGNTTVRGNLFVTSNAAAGTVTRIEYNIPHPFMLMGAS